MNMRLGNTVSQAVSDTKRLLELLENQQNTLGEDFSIPSVLKCEEFIEELDAAEGRVLKILAHHRSCLRKAHNLQIPFHRRLPLEVIVQTIDLSTGRRHENAGDAVLKRLVELSTVCSLWNEVVQSTPPLWSNIHSDDGQHLTDKALSISGSSPLDVVVISEGQNDREWLLLRLVPHIPRCRSFALHLNTAASLRPILAHPAPLLESFDVMLASSGHQVGPSEFFAGTTPRLRDLEIQSVDLNLEPVSTLRSLIINDTGPQNPSLTGLVAILRHNPLLEQLTLHTMEMCADGTSHLPPIHLPHLRQITLSQIPERSAQHLLSILQIPSCEFFLFGGASSASQHASSLDTVSLGHVLQVVAPVVALKGLVLIQICESYPFACGAARQPSKLRSTSPGFSQKPPYDLFVRLRRANVEASLKSFVNSVVQRLQDFEVIVELEDDLAEITDWADCLDLIPRLTELHVPVRVLTWLKSCLRTPGATQHPKLRRIVIAEWDPRRLPSLVALVESRYGATKGEELVAPEMILEVQGYNVNGELKILDVMKYKGGAVYVLYS